MCTGNGSLRCFCVAGVGQCALARGRMYALASLWCPLGSAAFAWQAWDNVHCQGVGCTPWRPSGVPWAPLLLHGRRGTMCTVRPGVPLVSLGLRCFCVESVGQCALPRGRALASLWCMSLGLRRFCVAGVGQCAQPRGRMYALASLWCPLGSAAFAWQAWDNRFCVAGVGQCALPRGRMYALLFLILLPSSYSSSRPPTHSHTSSLITHTHSLSHNHTHSLSQHFTHTPRPTHSHTHSHTLAHSYHTHSPHHSSHTHPHTLVLLQTRRHKHMPLNYFGQSLGNLLR